MATLFQLPKATPISAGSSYASAKCHFYQAGTTTNITTYTTAAMSVAHANPVVADSNGVFAPIFIDEGTNATYKMRLVTSADALIYEVDNLTAVPSQANIGATLWPRTTAETSAGVTPTYYYYEPGNVKRYGAVGDGTTNDTTSIQAALTSTHTVYIPAGTYQCQGLTQATNGQRIYGDGNLSVLRKRANGAILTCSGSHVEIEGVKFSGDASTPTFTGDNLVLNGDHPRLINCASRWAYARAVYAPVAHVQIVGTCDIYQTTASGASDYDIVIGVSGTATLYHAISHIYTSQNTGGIHFIDCGGHSVVGSQFGKLFVDAGTSPAGVNGGSYSANRINGNVAVELSSAAFAGNIFGGSTITLVAGSSGHSIDDSNTLDASLVITDNSTNSNVVDVRQAPLTSYAMSWTGASVNPAIGNGTVASFYSKRGRIVDVFIKIVMGSTTTFGTGAWFFSLPFVPTTSVQGVGSALVVDDGTNFRTGACLALQDGTARCQGYIDSDTAAMDSGRPMTWAVNDTLRLSLSYST